MAYTPEDKFIDQLRHYLNIEMTPKNKERIKGFIDEMTPHIVKEVEVVKEVVKIVKNTEIRYRTPFDNKRTEVLEGPLEFMQTHFKEVCDNHGYTTDEVIQGGRAMSSIRGEFIQSILRFHFYRAQTLADFLQIDRTTALYWMYPEKWRSKRNKQSLEKYHMAKWNTGKVNFSEGFRV